MKKGRMLPESTLFSGSVSTANPCMFLLLAAVLIWVEWNFDFGTFFGRESEHKLSDAEEQLVMFREMLQAKDQVVMNLTNQLFELEHKSPDEKTHGLDLFYVLFICTSACLLVWLAGCWIVGLAAIC